MNLTSLLVLAAVANFNAPDLGKLQPGQVKVYKADAIPWIADGKAAMPIIWHGKKQDTTFLYWSHFTWNAAQWLQSAVKEMTGVEPPIVKVTEGMPLPKGPGLFIGDAFAKAAGIACPDAAKHQFRVVSKDGSLYFCGRAEFAVYDFGERVLGIRQYWKLKEDGRSVVKAPSIALPEIDYSDAPVFPRREFWPYEYTDYWFHALKGGTCHPTLLIGHAPHTWHKDTNFNYAVTRPEIFALTRDGRRATSPMLCYSNPKTFDTYVERLEMELKGGPKSGIYHPQTKCISVEQWDAMIDCRCEGCRKLYNEKAGTSGNASPIIWGHFTKRLSEHLAKTHPEITIMTCPYLNTCDVPAGLTFPAKNVEGLVCAMPGFAMFKEKSVWDREIDLALQWEKVQGRPVSVCQYSCWPADFCNAPMLFGHVAQDYFRRMKGHIVGSFGNGPCPFERVILSSYVWIRSMWNFDFDVEKTYDLFAERMFGAGARPMRKIIAMQETGWMRPWPVAQVSQRNTYEISYPRPEVVEMERLFAEAKKLAAGDSRSLRRIAWYEKGFETFFKESAEFASGTALESTLIQKAASDPKLDGILDDACWKKAKAYSLVEGHHATNQVRFATTVRLVWTPNGVTIGYEGYEPNADDAAFREKCHAKGDVERSDTFLDFTGRGSGAYWQVYSHDNGATEFYTYDSQWEAKGVKVAWHFGDRKVSTEIFIPAETIKAVPGAQYPEGTIAGGKFWLGNFLRERCWDQLLPKSEAHGQSLREHAPLHPRQRLGKGPRRLRQADFCRIDQHSQAVKA